MSLYNMVCGQNGAAGAILATLGLTTSDVGRFRDCFISEGEIAVYTRNGGGNRECWHCGGDRYGNKTCKHHVEHEEVDETVEVTEAEAKEKGYELLNVYIGNKRLAMTGKRVVEPRYICEEPGSEHCTCPGCVIEHRLPQHPCYLRDEDDSFDCTYATIYFRFPEEFAEELKKFDSGEKFEPSKRWADAIAALESDRA